MSIGGRIDNQNVLAHFVSPRGVRHSCEFPHIGSIEDGFSPLGNCVNVDNADAAIQATAREAVQRLRGWTGQPPSLTAGFPARYIVPIFGIGASASIARRPIDWQLPGISGKAASFMLESISLSFLIDRTAKGFQLEWDSIGPMARRMCESWDGFDTLQGVMNAYPDVEWYVAGGVVRDLMSERGISPKDFDFFLGGGDIESVLAELASHGTLRYGQFGSPRWWPGPDVECYADIIPIERFRNGLWICQDIVDVLNQFDFTANAVAVDLRRLSVFNPQNGVRDACGRIMRAVRFDYPDEPIVPGSRLSRPFVLWCRLLHYSAALGYEIDPVTLAWLRANAGFIDRVAEFENVFFSVHPDAFAPLSEGLG